MEMHIALLVLNNQHQSRNQISSIMCRDTRVVLQEVNPVFGMAGHMNLRKVELEVALGFQELMLRLMMQGWAGMEFMKSVGMGRL